MYLGITNLPQLGLEVVAKHSLLKVANCIARCQDFKISTYSKTTCGDEEDEQQGSSESSGNGHKLRGSKEALVHLNNECLICICYLIKDVEVGMGLAMVWYMVYSYGLQPACH